MSALYCSYITSSVSSVARLANTIEAERRTKMMTLFLTNMFSLVVCKRAVRAVSTEDFYQIDD